MHQLPADAAAPPRLGRGVPHARARRRRRAHARVRVRARAATSARRCAPRHPVAGGARQRLRDLEAYANQYWPAKYLIDRSGRIRPHALRRGRVRRDGGADPRAPGRAGDEPPTPVADTTPKGVPTPETYLGYARLDAASRRRRRSRTGSRATVPRAARPPDSSRTPAAGRSSASGSWPARRAAAAPLPARDVYLVLGGHGAASRPRRRAPAAAVRVSGTGSTPRAAARRLRARRARAALHAGRRRLRVHVREPCDTAPLLGHTRIRPGELAPALNEPPR